MKVALVFPPASNSIEGTCPDFVAANVAHLPPLGIMYIASYLKKHIADLDILVIDSIAEKLDYTQIAQRVVDFGADIVGISCWTFSLIDTLMVAKEIKRLSPSTMICLGGPHINLYAEETISMDCVDFVITGDGERPFAYLIEQLKAARDFASVPNLWYRNNGSIQNSSLTHMEMDLDGLPFPDRNQDSLWRYNTIMDKTKPITTLITSRGCPFDCSFCYNQKSGYRCRSISNVIEEIEYCVSLGIRNFFIFDETFTVDKKRVLGLCNELKARKLDITWNIRSRVDTIDEEAFDALRESGCKCISFGIESAHPDVLKRLNKNITILCAREVFKLAKKKKMRTIADFMIGCPEENIKRTYQTIRLAKELNPDYAQFSLFMLLPATRLYEEALKEKIVKDDVWFDYAHNPRKDFKPPLWNVYSEKKAKKMLIFSYRIFYLRFSYIAKCLFGLRSIEQLKAYFSVGFGLLKAVFRGS